MISVEVNILCDNENCREGGGEIVSELDENFEAAFREASKRAASDGWQLTADGKAYCPVCRKD